MLRELIPIELVLLELKGFQFRIRRQRLLDELLLGVPNISQHILRHPVSQDFLLSHRVQILELLSFLSIDVLESVLLPCLYWSRLDLGLSHVLEKVDFDQIRCRLILVQMVFPASSDADTLALLLLDPVGQLEEIGLEHASSQGSVDHFDLWDLHLLEFLVWR